MQIKSSLYLLSPGPLKRHINVARIIYKAVFFTAAMVTKFKVKNPPFILPLKLLQLKSQLIIAVLILLLFQSCNSPISHLLYSPESLNFFHSHNVFLYMLLFIYLFHFTFHFCGYTHAILIALDIQQPLCPKEIISYIKCIKKTHYFFHVKQIRMTTSK